MDEIQAAIMELQDAIEDAKDQKIQVRQEVFDIRRILAEDNISETQRVNYEEAAFISMEIYKQLEENIATYQEQIKRLREMGMVALPPQQAPGPRSGDGAEDMVVGVIGFLALILVLLMLFRPY